MSYMRRREWTRVQAAEAIDPPGFLCTRRERPRRSAAKQRDELALVHSITSSARASSVGGTSRGIRGTNVTEYLADAASITPP